MNRRKKQIGHLFQGRYKELLIDANSYLLELVCYIHNNYVRAGMVKTPDEYAWSSHNIHWGNALVPLVDNGLGLVTVCQMKLPAASYGVSQQRIFLIITLQAAGYLP